jgi:hypothetical protein
MAAFRFDDDNWRNIAIMQVRIVFWTDHKRNYKLYIDYYF